MFTLTAPETEIGRKFAEDGYYVAKGVFNPAEIRDLEEDFDRIVAQLYASGENINATWGGPEMERMGAAKMQVIHTHNVQLYSARWAKALFQDRFIAAARDILGENIILNHTKLFQKPSENGAPFPMHQDWEYFPTIKDTMMAGIIHVSNATDEMGCLRVYPGTHKLGRIGGSNGHSEQLLNDYPIENATPLEAEPGDVVFFHYFTIHGSMPNRSSSVRKTVLVQLYAGEDRIEEGCAHPDERLVLSGWNSHATRNAANRQKA